MGFIKNLFGKKPGGNPIWNTVRKIGDTLTDGAISELIPVHETKEEYEARMRALTEGVDNTQLAVFNNIMLENGKKPFSSMDELLAFNAAGGTVESREDMPPSLIDSLVNDGISEGILPDIVKDNISPDVIEKIGGNKVVQKAKKMGLAVWALIILAVGGTLKYFGIFGKKKRGRRR